MTKEQAIEILDKAVASIQTTRQNHQMLLEALKVLAKETKDEGLSN